MEEVITSLGGEGKVKDDIMTWVSEQFSEIRPKKGEVLGNTSILIKVLGERKNKPSENSWDGIKRGPQTGT